jgi:SAM-dependent methyltransferase
VAYVVRHPGGKPARALSADAEAERTAEWRQIYEGVYHPGRGRFDPAFNIVGWNSSYTGQPLSAEEMQEHVDSTVQRITELGGRRILEIGCGTGLLLFRLAGNCERYLATDFSARVVGTVRQECARRGLGQVEAVERAADDFSGIEPGTFDGVILNSVVQYFPGIDYLMRVLAGAVRAVRPGGWVFVGDVRSRPLLRWLHAGIELARSSDDTGAAELRTRIERRLAQEQELAIEPEFFAAWSAVHLPGGDAGVEVRRGRHLNELVKFRYDVVLAVGGDRGPPLPWEEKNWEEFGTAPALAAYLQAHQPAALLVRRVPSRRLAGERRLMELLDAPEQIGTAAELRRESALAAGRGADPEELWALEGKLAYTLRVGWSEPANPGSYHVWCVASRCARKERWAWRAPGSDQPETRPWSTYANAVAGLENPQSGTQHLREYLRQRLPEHMVPSQFVWLERLPLTPNGKLDRRALPSPGPEDCGAGYIAPESPLENSIAAIWSEVLGVERVGVNTNFFDLGGHSLLLVRVHSRLTKTLPTSLSVIDLFIHPTVRALAEAITLHPARGENSGHPFADAPRRRADPPPFKNQGAVLT